MAGVSGLQVALFVVCLVLSAFFSSAETALISLPRLKIKHLVSIGKQGAERVERIMDEPSKFLAAMLLGNNLVNIGAAAIGTTVAIAALGLAWGALVATLVVTTLLLVFSEVGPKTFAAHHAERVAFLYAIPVQLVIWILYPFVWVLNHIGLRFARIMAEDEDKKNIVSEDEILTAITVGEAEGVWKEDEAEMLHNALEFADRPVKEVMQQRTDIAWIEQGISLAEFLGVYRKAPYSRFPVYEGTPDTVVGVLTIKDVLMALSDNSLAKDSPIDGLVREVHFVPESKHLGELLAEMRNKNYHMVVVIDEYGGVAGIATLEHLTADIMGTIGDELAAKEKDFVTIDANTYEVDGSLRIEEANEELDLGLPAGDYETIAGFILSRLGRIPKQGENLKYKNLKLVILEMRDRKVERVVVTKEKDATPAS